MLKSLDRMLRVDPGFQPEGLVSARVSLPRTRYRTPADGAAFFHDLVARLEGVPGIEAASGTSHLPFSGEDQSSSFQVVGREVPDSEKQPEANRRTVIPGFHELMGIPLLRGRHLTSADRVEASPVVVVSQALAERHWPDGDALGARIYRDRREFEVVGIVGDVLHREMDGETQATFYVPLDVAENRSALALVVRSSLPAEATSTRIREAVRAVDPEVPVENVATLSALLDLSTREERFRALLLAAFAAAATTLAGLGLFGSTARLAGARRRELGIRLALGARRGALLTRVALGEAPVLVGGLAMGLIAAWGATSQVAAYLFEVSRVDPTTWISAGAGLLAVAAAATLWAAGGALRVDPVETMRVE